MRALTLERQRHTHPDDRFALGVFVLAAIGAVPLLLYLGRDQWFFLDEWWLLGDGSRSVDGLLDPHNGHWITVNTILYRINYSLWGLRTYVPYQLPVILLHVGSAVLLRAIARRLGARGWIATIAALSFLVFGSGSLNIFFGFQVSLTGSLFLGLVLLLLADRDGAIQPVDWVALPVGFLGLMTSGAFVPMVIGVGVLAFVRRGAGVAAFYTVPFGLLFGSWYVAFGRDGSLSISSPGDVLRFGYTMLTGTFSALARTGLGGIALALVVGGALTVLARSAVASRRWSGLALPAGLVSAWVVFAGLSALARASGFGAESGASDRYLHISAALLLPLIALGAEHLARWNLLAGVLPVLVLVAGIPGNFNALTNREPFELGRADQQLIPALAHSQHIDDVPTDLEPVRLGPFDLPITTGWLAREAKAGNIPEPARREDPITSLTNLGLLALDQDDGAGGRDCPKQEAELVEMELQASDEIVFEGDVLINVRDGLTQSRPIGFSDAHGSAIVAVLGPLDLVIRGGDVGPPRLCEP